MKAQAQPKRVVQRQLSYEEDYEEDEQEVISLSEDEEEEEQVVVAKPKPQPKPQAKPQAQAAPKPKMAAKPKLAEAPDDEAKTKSDAKPKAQKEVSYEEVSELLEALGFVFKPRHLKSMSRHHKKLYARLVELVKPRLKFTSHATPVGRLIYFVAGPDPLAGGGWGGNDEGYYAVGDFVTVCNNESVVLLSQYESAKTVDLKSLCDAHLVGEDLPPLSKNRDEQLYALIKGGFIETDAPQLESKMSECVYVDDKTKRAYWLNTQEGKKALGPVVNAQNIKKLNQEALEKEWGKLDTLRDELLALFGEYADAVAADEASGKNKRKATDEEDEDEPAAPVEKKQRTETGAKKITPPAKPAKPTATVTKSAPPAKKSDAGEGMDVERSVKSTTAAKTKPPVTPPAKKAAQPPPAPQKKKPVQPTKVTTVTTVQVGELSDDVRQRIQKMATGEIRAMLSKVGDAATTTGNALHEKEWYHKYL